MNVLTLNAGSNSLKVEIVAADTSDGTASTDFGRSVLSAAFDDIGKPTCGFRLFDGKRERHHEALHLADHGAATRWLLDWLAAGHARSAGLQDLSSIGRVGHRVVQGADRLTDPVRITAQVRSQIAELGELAPLHTGSVLKVIDAASPRFEVPMIAVIDSAFHRTLPEEAAAYALPPDLAQRHRIRRYGFHGISHQYLALRFAQIVKRPPADLRLVTLHLEGGSSAAAIRGGQSVDTSMGMTPLDGLMMGSRSGDLDPGIVLQLMRKEGWDADRVERFLNQECGLKGVSGVSADSRELEKHLAEPRVRLAWDMFCYRVSKYVAAYLAVLGGADAIIFAGGIGENTPSIREQVCARLAWCGAVIDARANAGCIDREACVSSAGASIPIWVIPTQEGLMMAREVARWRAV